MKKNIENLLFNLLESSSLSFQKADNEREVNKIILKSKEPTLLKVTLAQGRDESDKVSVKCAIMDKNQNHEKKTIVILAHQITNFLNVVALERERVLNDAFINDYGINKFNQLKSDMLDIMMQKSNNNFLMLDFQHNKYGQNVQVNIDDKDTTATFVATFKTNQRADNMNPFTVSLQALIPKENKLISQNITILIPFHELEKYPLIPKDPPSPQDDVELIDYLIKANSSRNYMFESKAISKFSMDTMLEEKNITDKKNKI